MKASRKSTPKEIFAAIASVIFSVYIISLLVLQEISLESAERVNVFLLQWIVNIALGGGAAIFTGGLVLYLLAWARRHSI